MSKSTGLHPLLIVDVNSTRNIENGWINLYAVISWLIIIKSRLVLINAIAMNVPENVLLFRKLTRLIWNSILNVYEIRMKLEWN